MKNFCWPIEEPRRIFSPFGWRLDPFGSGAWAYHAGIDMAPKIPDGQAPTCGAPVYAVAAGHVITDDDVFLPGNAGADPCGKMVILRHEDEQHGIFYTRYLHLADNTVECGQAVAAGEIIGHMGTTGASTGPHLHFDMFLGSANPADWRIADPTPCFGGLT